MGSIFGSFHPDRELKLVTAEPNLAPRESAYLAAQRHSFIPGAFYLLASIVLIYLMLSHPQAVGRVVGLHWQGTPWTLPMWLLAALVAAAVCSSTAALAYDHATGKSYGEDRVGFAAAGGFDIARWMGLAGYLVSFAVFWATAPPASGADPLRYVRGPWLFLLVGSALGQAMTWWTARHVFRARFGRPGPPLPWNPRASEPTDPAPRSP
jgi:hypothetical protein